MCTVYMYMSDPQIGLYKIKTLFHFEALLHNNNILYDITTTYCTLPAQF